ncbi:MFS transporter [Psittacicella hinzii]|uniref:Major facilitator superfamily (MFS) profile domain-containing protein n=1 Tax=Psittacicella hinzii TaxID=2028575 RepID=A0A3A1YKC7_9GAMM|nr:MFS transporter [Psittacicella hinzii]RIY38723.1 hypothetical protein CKF58_03560 [Psittacicella hinzii]
MTQNQQNRDKDAQALAAQPESSHLSHSNQQDISDLASVTANASLADTQASTSVFISDLELNEQNQATEAVWENNEFTPAFHVADFNPASQVQLASCNQDDTHVNHGITCKAFTTVNETTGEINASSTVLATNSTAINSPATYSSTANSSDVNSSDANHSATNTLTEEQAQQTETQQFTNNQSGTTQTDSTPVLTDNVATKQVSPEHTYTKSSDVELSGTESSRAEQNSTQCTATEQATEQASAASTKQTTNSQTASSRQRKRAHMSSSSDHETIDTGRVGFEEVSEFQKQLEPQLPKQFWFFTLLYFVCMFAGFVNNSFAPAIEAMAQDFQVGVSAITSIIVYYTIGNGLGQFIWGSLMDSIGRKATILICGYGGIFLNLWLMNAHNYGELQTVRILQGLIYSGLGVIPSVMLRDCYSAKRYVIYSGWLSSLFVLTPVIAPLIGAYIFIYLGWQAIFGILSMVMLIVLVCFSLFVPETLDPQRAQPISLKRTWQAYGIVLTRKSSVWLIIYNSIFTITTVLLPTMLPMVYIIDYHVAPKHFGWLVLINTILMVLGLQLNSWLVKRGYSPAKILLGASIAQALATTVTIYTLISGVTLLGVIVSLGICVIFTSLIIGNTLCIFAIDYNNMIGTAGSLFAGIRLAFAGGAVALLAHIPSYHGKTLLIIHAIVILIAAFMYFFYYHKFRPDLRLQQTSKDFKSKDAKA